MAGEPIALSGISSSGFPHLHFEFREGSVFRRDAIHPFRYLPYSDTIRHTSEISATSSNGTVWVHVTAPDDELDVIAISVTVEHMGNGAVLDHRLVDFEERNKRYEGDPAILDNPDLDQIILDPRRFTSTSSLYELGVQFYGLNGLGAVRIHACAIDVQGNRACSSQNTAFGPKEYLPIVGRRAD